MKLRDFIFDDTEGKYLELDNKIISQIISKIENKHNIKFKFDKNSDELLILLLFST